MATVLPMRTAGSESAVGSGLKPYADIVDILDAGGQREILGSDASGIGME